MAIPDDIPVRSNGQEILATWFNTIRTVLLAITGSESLSQTSFSGAASQTGTSVTSFIFDSSTTIRVDAKWTVETATKFGGGDFVLLYDGSNWAIYEGALYGVDTGITFDVNTSTGQVTYDSGGETFTLYYKAETFNA